MKNKKITIYELMGLIKDGKAPKEIKYDNIILEYDEFAQDYKANSCFNDDTNYLLCHLFRYPGALDIRVEILPEENDEWEDIEKIGNSADDTLFTMECYTGIPEKHKIGILIFLKIK